MHVSASQVWLSLCSAAPLHPGLPGVGSLGFCGVGHAGQQWSREGGAPTTNARVVNCAPWHLATRPRVWGWEPRPLDVPGRGWCLRGQHPSAAAGMARAPDHAWCSSQTGPRSSSGPLSGARAPCAEGRSPRSSLSVPADGAPALGHAPRNRSSGFLALHTMRLHTCVGRMYVCPSCCFPTAVSLCSVVLPRLRGARGESSPLRLRCSWVTPASSLQGCAAEGPAHDRPGFWHQCIFAAPDQAHVLLPHQQHPSPDGTRRVLARARGQGGHPLSSMGPGACSWLPELPARVSECPLRPFCGWGFTHLCL